MNDFPQHRTLIMILAAYKGLRVVLGKGIEWRYIDEERKASRNGCIDSRVGLCAFIIATPTCPFSALYALLLMFPSSSALTRQPLYADGKNDMGCIAHFNNGKESEKRSTPGIALPRPFSTGL